VFVGQRFIQPDIPLAMTFPDDWKTINRRNAVLAHPEDESAYVVLELSGKGDDPMQAAKEFGSKNRLSEPPAALTIHGLLAAEAELKTGGNAIHLTWIASGGMIYRIAGIGKREGWAGFRPLFRETAASFHVPSRAELDEVTELRLELARARQGESLEALMKRTGCELEVAQIAVANGLQVDEPLKKGQLVKIAKRFPYTPKPRPEPAESESQ